MDFIRVWPEGTKPYDNMMSFAEKLSHLSGKGFKYFVADLNSDSGNRCAYTTVVCDAGESFRQCLDLDLYANVIQADKDWKLDYAVEKYFSAPGCPDKRYKDTLF